MASTLSVDNIQGSASANTIDMSSVTNLHPPAGMVIQVVHGKLTGQVATTGVNGSAYIVDIRLNATITPRFANSKIKIDVTTYVGADAAGSSGYIQSYMIYKGGSKLTGPTGDGVGGRRPVTGFINMYNPTSSSTVVTHRVGFLGGTYETEFTLDDREDRTPILFDRAFMNRMNVMVNPNRKYVVTTKYSLE